MFEADVPLEDIQNGIESIMSKYEDEHYSFQVYHLGGGYQFLTKPAYQASISIFLKQQSKRRLSTSALETLSIIAYKQPVTKLQVEQIRGVNCDYTIQKLLEKEVIFREDLEEIFGKRAWDPELTETPVSNKENKLVEEVTVEEQKQEESDSIAFPESGGGDQL